MRFKEAWELMKQGAAVKLPAWGGYWCLDSKGETILMHTKDGEVLDIRQTDRPFFTFSNIASDEWQIADEENCPVMGGEATFSFGDAIKYVKRGMKVSRKGWNGKNQYVFLAKDIEFVTEADLSDLNPNHVEECTEENMVHVPDCLAIRTAGRKIQLGWLASQADMLAEDWTFAN